MNLVAGRGKDVADPLPLKIGERRTQMATKTKSTWRLAAVRGDVDAVTYSFPTAMKGVADRRAKLTALFVVAARVGQVGL